MPRLDQLRLLDIEQIEMSLAFLAGYRPSFHSAVLPDEPFGWLRAALVGRPEAYCVTCEGLVGIFLGFGQEWRHFRREADAGVMYDAGHAAAIGWRYVPAPRSSARTVNHPEP